jgi:hypothetical protein
MRGRIVTAARVRQIHRIVARGALTHDEAGRHGKTRSNGVLSDAHCADHRVRRCGRLLDAPFFRIGKYQISSINRPCDDRAGP